MTSRVSAGLHAIARQAFRASMAGPVPCKSCAEPEHDSLSTAIRGALAAAIDATGPLEYARGCSDIRARVRQAIHDPGSLLPRVDSEDLTAWQIRAVFKVTSEDTP